MDEKPSEKRPKDGKNLSPELIDAMVRDAGMGVATHAEESADSSDEDDPLNGVTFGLSVLEKFLLSIIDAHKIENSDRRSRLNTAMNALVNRDASHGALPPDPNKAWREQEVLLDSALLWMANEYASAIGKKPSIRELAFAAADKFFPTVSPQQRNSKMDDLRGRFNGSYEKKLKHYDPSNPTDIRRTHIYRATQHDYVRESVEHQILRRVRDEFATAGLHLILPDE